MDIRDGRVVLLWVSCALLSGCAPPPDRLDAGLYLRTSPVSPLVDYFNLIDVDKGCIDGERWRDVGSLSPKRSEVVFCVQEGEAVVKTGNIREGGRVDDKGFRLLLESKTGAISEATFELVDESALQSAISVARSATVLRQAAALKKALKIGDKDFRVLLGASLSTKIEQGRLGSGQLLSDDDIDRIRLLDSLPANVRSDLTSHSKASTKTPHS